MNFALIGNAPVNYLLIVGFSAMLVIAGIPSVIHISNKLKLFDNNNIERKNHRAGISRLGGIAVFCSLVLTSLLFSDMISSHLSNYVLSAFILIFAVGLKDDLWGVNPSSKFFVQLISALTIVLLADIRITNMHGIFNIWELPFWGSVVFSTLLIIFMTNAFNLIDGIDGLVGMTAMITGIVFGLFFMFMDQHSYACIAFTIAGASFGFLHFNLLPARIFMGDAGSMLIGLVASILAINFIELNIPALNGTQAFQAAPAIAMAILIGPIFDVLRVFFLRILNRRSPFVADNNHLHHRLLRLGLTHHQTTMILMSFNNLLLTFVLYFREMNNTLLITALFAGCMLFNIFLTFLISYQERKSLQLVSAVNRRQSELTAQLNIQPGRLAFESAGFNLHSKRGPELREPVRLKSMPEVRQEEMSSKN